MTDIKTLNDNLRKSFIGGRVILTQGINAKMPRDIARILAKVRNFNNFTKDNDPYGEHDFGSFDYNGEKIYWKIDYYDKSYCYLSENPANLDITNRVLVAVKAATKAVVIKSFFFISFNSLSLIAIKVCNLAKLDRFTIHKPTIVAGCLKNRCIPD